MAFAGDWIFWNMLVSWIFSNYCEMNSVDAWEVSKIKDKRRRGKRENTALNWLSVHLHQQRRGQKVNCILVSDVRASLSTLNRETAMWWHTGDKNRCFSWRESGHRRISLSLSPTQACAHTHTHTHTHSHTHAHTWKHTRTHHCHLNNAEASKQINGRRDDAVNWH